MLRILSGSASALLALTLQLATVAPASAQDTPSASLVRATGGDGVRTAYLGAVDRILRARVDELGVVEVRGQMALDIEELQLALGCLGETVECLAQITTQLDVSVLLLPNVDVAGDEIVLSIARFDAGPEPSIRRVAHRSPAPNAETRALDAIDGMLRELFDLPPVAPDERARSADGGDETRRADGALERGPEPTPAETASGGPELVGPVVVLGAGAATLLAGAVTGGLFASEASAFAAPVTQASDVAERDGHRRSADDFALATNVLLVAGGAVLAGGLVWLIVELAGGDAESGTVSLTPLLGPDLAMLSATVRLPEAM